MPRNIDNDTLLASNPHGSSDQLALPLAVESIKPDLMTPEQRKTFDDFCLSVRRERDQIFALCCQRWPKKSYQTAPEVENDHWQMARAEILGSHIAYPNPAQITGPRQLPQYKPYRGWTLERKQQSRARKLREKALKYSTFPDLWIPWVQERLLLNPRSYGVCPLPDSCLSCPVDYASELKKDQVIERENFLRKKEAGILVPVNLPLTQKPEPSKVPIHAADRSYR